MKFNLKLADIGESILYALKRFPLEIVFSLMITVCIIWTIDTASPPEEIVNLIFASIFGFILSLNVSLTIEGIFTADKAKRVYRLFGVLLVSVATFVYYLLLPEEVFNADTKTITRILLLNVSLVAFLLVSPFWKNWKLSKDKGYIYEFIRELITWGFISVIIAIALNLLGFLAIGAIDYLFELDISSEFFSKWPVIVYGFIAPIVFLSKVPKTYVTNPSDKMPPSNKLIINIALLPFALIYFTILYVYTAKVLVTWDWPQGEITWMIILFSALGWFVWIALLPYKSANALYKFYVKYYPIILIPQIIVMFIALSFRLSDFGWTVNRYYIALFGVWMLGLAIYYFFAKVKNVKVGVISFALIILLSVWGPLSCFSVTERSQYNRMVEQASEMGIVKDGVIDSDILPVSGYSYSDVAELRESIYFMNNNFGNESLLPLFSELEDETESESDYRWAVVDDLMNEICGSECSEYRSSYDYYEDDYDYNYQYEDDYYEEVEDDVEYLNYQVEDLNERFVVEEISNYDYMIEFDFSYGSSYLDRTSIGFTLDNTQYFLSLSDDKDGLAIKTVSEDVLELDIFNAIIDKYDEGYIYMPEDDMTFEGSKGVFSIKVLLESTSFTLFNGDIDQVTYSGTALIKED